jgi:hypothetical protein
MRKVDVSLCASRVQGHSTQALRFPPGRFVFTALFGCESAGGGWLILPAGG